MHTLWQTSDIRFAIRSLTSLCRTVGKPPFGHSSACSTEKLCAKVASHTPESNGISEGTFVEGEGKFLQRKGCEPT